jgi:hypothetical protein
MSRRFRFRVGRAVLAGVVRSASSTTAATAVAVSQQPIRALVNAMTRDEKLSFVHGSRDPPREGARAVRSRAGVLGQVCCRLCCGPGRA